MCRLLRAAAVLLLLAHGGAKDEDNLPSSGPDLTELGSLRLGQGDVAGAQRAFDKAVRLFPGVSLAWYNLAVAASKGGQLGRRSAHTAGPGNCRPGTWTC